jgi:hypothetical protein
MSNIVFVLGAGASQQAGAPLMGNFLDVASDLLRANKVQDKRDDFERVFSAIGGLQAVHSKAQLDLNNIESIFTALELGRIIKRVPGIDELEVEATISSLKELIVKTLETTIEFPTNRSYIGVPEPYGSFAGLVKYLRQEAFPEQTVSVITFNYDIGADIALFRENLGPNYIVEPAPGTQNAVDLLKLHGSLNWATVRGTGKIRPLHLRDYFNKYSLQWPSEHSRIKVPIGSQLQEYFTKYDKSGIEIEANPVIVPPSWNKADYHQALTDVWAAAAKHLSEAESVFIIGYSLPQTDSFFRHLYALGSVGAAALRRIFIFNPDESGDTDGRFQALLGSGARSRYEYYPVTFDKAMPVIKDLFPARR